MLVIPVAWSCADPTRFANTTLLLMIVVAIASDYWDGKVARKLNTASATGQLFDHSTDFLFVSAGLFGAAYTGQISPWLPILIVLAFSQYVIDSYFLYRQKQLRMSFLGRWNGVFYFLPLLLIALTRLEPLASIQPILHSLLLVIVFALTLSTLASMLDRALAPLRTR